MTRTWLYRELGAQHPVASLAEGLRQTDRIRYRANGNRAADPRRFVAKVEAAMSAIGVTRVADISFLAATNYPVFQSTRPAVFHHAAVGQNTGAQGKGPTPLQAKLSAMMESLEGYCAEPRVPRLVRASYRYLAGHHLVADPAKLTQCEEPDPYDADTPLMWTTGYCLQAGQEVLVPAEAAYFPFFPRTFETPSLFPCGTNGLASGATYLEAVIHALYEVIERHYITLLDRGALHVEAMFEEEVRQATGRPLAAGAGYEVQLYACELRPLPAGARNLPFVMCVLVGDDAAYAGYGCSCNVEMSIVRAVSEAYQQIALDVSGAREDLDPEIHAESQVFQATPQPTHRTLRLAQLRRRVHDRTFTTLRDEYRFVLAALRALGVQRTYAVNLTRQGIDIPVVKVISEAMLAPDVTRRGVKLDANALLAATFPAVRTARERA